MSKQELKPLTVEMRDSSLDSIASHQLEVKNLLVQQEEPRASFDNAYNENVDVEFLHQMEAEDHPFSHNEIDDEDFFIKTMEEQYKQRKKAAQKRFGFFNWILKGLSPRNYKVVQPKTHVNLPHSQSVVMWNYFSDSSGSKLDSPKDEIHLETINGVVVKEGQTLQQQQPTEHKEEAPLKTPHIIVRIISLLLIFMTVFGPSMLYASVGALSSFIRNDYHIDDSQYAVLFSVYSLPNIVAVFVAGIIADFAVNGTTLACVVLFMGGTLLALIDNYWCLLIGRIIYGIGAECIGVVQSALVARWFIHDKIITLAFASAFSLLSFRISAFFMMFAIPQLGPMVGLTWSLVIIAAIVFISAVCCVGIVILDCIFKKYVAVKKPPSFHPIKLIKDFFHLPLIFWIICAVSVLYYVSVSPFISFSNDLFVQKFNMSIQDASTASSILYGAATIFLIPAGFLIDRLGHRLTVLFASFVLVIISYSLLLFTNLTPYVSCVLLGISYATAPAALWPSIPLVVDDSLLGTGYGLVTALINFGLFIVPLYIGYIPDMSYKLLAVFITSCLGLLGSAILFFDDGIQYKFKIEFTCVTKVRLFHFRPKKASKKVLQEVMQAEKEIGHENPDEYIEQFEMSKAAKK